MDDAKFELFTKIADSLFQSFQAMTKPNSFVELSSSMLSWLEQVCTSQVFFLNTSKTYPKSN
jgi:hypothetical protein